VWLKHVERGFPSSARVEGSIARESLPRRASRRRPPRRRRRDPAHRRGAHARLVALLARGRARGRAGTVLCSSLDARRGIGTRLSRYEARFAEGKEPENIDKEFLRLWYRERCDPYKDEVIPKAPDELVCELARRYVLLFELITGTEFDFEAAAADVDRPAAVAAALA